MTIKRKLYKKYLTLAKEQFDKSDPLQNKSKYINELSKVYLINSLILIELALESFINDFGYNNIVNYEYLERISIKNRVEILPKIAKKNPKEIIKTNDELYNDINQLIKYRNIFVHRDSEEKLEKVFDRLDYEVVNKFYVAVKKLMEKFDSHFHIFGKEDYFLSQLETSWL